MRWTRGGSAPSGICMSGKRSAECSVRASPGRGSRVLVVGGQRAQATAKHWMPGQGRTGQGRGRERVTAERDQRVCEEGGGVQRRKSKRREPGGEGGGTASVQCGWRTGVCERRKQRRR
jgi:hypothetical protein